MGNRIEKETWPSYSKKHSTLVFKVQVYSLKCCTVTMKIGSILRCTMCCKLLHYMMERGNP